MSSISGIEQLHDYLSTEELQKLANAANRHAEQSNISFTLLSASPDELQIEVVQAETKSGKYATENTLTTRTKDLFAPFFPKAKLNIHPVTYAPSPASIVTTKWLEQKMKEKGIRIKQISFETGVDRDSISDWVTGKRSMSQIVKAMLYFYLSK